MKKRPTYQKLEERVRRLDKKEPLEHRQLEEALRKRTKELNCLFTVLEIVNRPGIALDERLQQIADALPAVVPKSGTLWQSLPTGLSRFGSVTPSREFTESFTVCKRT